MDESDGQALLKPDALLDMALAMLTSGAHAMAMAFGPLNLQLRSQCGEHGTTAPERP